MILARVCLVLIAWSLVEINPLKPFGVTLFVLCLQAKVNNLCNTFMLINYLPQYYLPSNKYNLKINLGNSFNPPELSSINPPICVRMLCFEGWVVGIVECCGTLEWSNRFSNCLHLLMGRTCYP